MPVAEGFRVATAYVALTIEEGDVQALIERAVTEACQKAGDEGGTLLAGEIGAAVDGVAPDLSAPLIESLAGAGETAAAEIAGSLTGRIAGAGEEGGAELAAALEAAAADVGTDIAGRVGGQLQADLPEQASAASAEMATELTAGTAHVGDTIAAQIGQQLTGGLDEAVRSGALALGQLGIVGTSSMLGIAGAGAGIAGALAAAVSDAAAEAGGIAGVELARNVAESAAAAMAGRDLGAFTDQLVEAASAAGDAAGAAVADSLGSSFVEAGAGADAVLGGLGAVGESMVDTAREIGAATGEALAAGEAAAVADARAAEAQLDAVFDTIYRNGSGLSVRLASAMTEAFQGIEADTAGFTAAELELFSQFYVSLEAGADQAMSALTSRIDRALSGVSLGTDLMGSGLASNGQPMPAAAGGQGELGGFMAMRPAVGEMEGELGGVEKAAAGASESIGGMASVMGGPWLFGIMGALSLLPMFSSMIGDNGEAAKQAAIMHQQLAQAVAQDSGGFGDSTAAMIQNALAQSNLMSLSNDLGVSQAQLIEYAAGETDAQFQVSAAYDTTSASKEAAAGMTEQYWRADTAAGDAAQTTLNKIEAQKAGLDKLTASVTGAILADRQHTETLLAAESSTEIYTAAVADLVAKQKLQAESSKMQADATLAYLGTLIPGTQAYNDAIEVQIAALDQSSVSARINADAFNELLPIQGRLSDAAIQAGLDYQDAGRAASAYKLALDGLTGQYEGTADAQAQFTLSLDGLKGKIDAGRDATDLNTEAGAKNFQQFKQAADEAKNYSEQLYKQTGDAGQATAALKEMAAKLDTAALKAGLTRDQVKQLNVELFGVPDVKTISIQADQSPARKAMSELAKFIEGEIHEINNTVIRPGVDSTFVKGAVNANIGPQLARHATGGPVQAGVPVITGDGGKPEVFVPNSDGRIYPSVGEGARALAKHGGGDTFNFNYFGTQHPTPEQRQIIMRDFSLLNRGGLNG